MGKENEDPWQLWRYHGHRVRDTHTSSIALTPEGLMLCMKYIKSNRNDRESGRIGIVKCCCIMSMILARMFVQVWLFARGCWLILQAEKVSKVTSTPEWMPLRPHPRNSQFIRLNVLRLQSCACKRVGGFIFIVFACLGHQIQRGLQPYAEHSNKFDISPRLKLS